MGGQWSQFFPPQPHFTEKDLPSLSGRVFVITGGYSGVGLELARILYRNKARVYIAGRSETKAQEAINDITKSSTVDTGSNSTNGNVGSLEFLHLDLSDLRTIKPDVQAFQSKEKRLDVLFNNVGVAQPPLGSLSAQGHDLQIATNSLGPFLLTQLLLPLLQTTAREFPESSVRVVWLSSQAVDLTAAKNGFSVDDIRSWSSSSPMDPGTGYVNSKLGNWYLSSEFARRHGNEKVISVVANPGSGNTNLFRYTWWLPWVAWPIMYKTELLANTIMFAGLSDEISERENGVMSSPGEGSTRLLGRTCWTQSSPRSRADWGGRPISGSTVRNWQEITCETCILDVGKYLETLHEPRLGKKKKKKKEKKVLLIAGTVPDIYAI